MLEVRALTVHYGKALALEDVNLEVPGNTLLAVIGPNGAGKTTLMRTISGLLRPTAGTVMFESRPLVGLAAHKVVRNGLVQCPEGRRPFPELAVIENLQLGMPLWASRAQAQSRLAEILELFPRLQERRRQMAGTLSGGEQQMLALARALMCRPRLLLLDEPSMGLAPKIVEEVFQVVARIRTMGVAVLLVEQNVELVLEICDRIAVLDHGRLVFDGTGEELQRNTRLTEVYLGFA
ncbi:MAG TPA: ABC transporter ATP-binding protein [Xanthobacteraceae bacterium]|jgi:branched-chain amino acid transport system ATP-binding protein